MKKSKNKTVIVTGGSKGIGASISEEFIKAGMNVIIGARHDNGLAKKLGNNAYFFNMDVKEENNHIKIIKEAIKLTGRIDVYINNAGFSKWVPIEEVKGDFWDDMINTNLKGTMWGCKAAAKFISKNGSIINISSLAGRRGSANNSVYCASKFGVIGLTQSLSKELGPKGIRVNALCPVYVETPGVLGALKDDSSPTKGKNVKSYFKDFINKQAVLGRLPEGKDIAQACLFLASENASAITGQSINIDCGVLPT